MKHSQIVNILSGVHSARNKLLTQEKYLDQICILFHDALGDFAPDDAKFPLIHTFESEHGVINLEWIFGTCRVGFFIEPIDNLEKSSWSVIFAEDENNPNMRLYSGWFKDIDNEELINLIREVAETGLRMQKNE